MRGLLVIAMLVALPTAVADANVTTTHSGDSSFAFASLRDLGCAGNATLELQDDRLVFRHHNGTSCAKATMDVPLPPGAAAIQVEAHHVRVAGDGLLSASLDVAPSGQAVALAPAHAADRSNLSVAAFDVVGEVARLEWRFDATGTGGQVILDDLHLSIRAHVAAVADLSRDSRLDGDFVDDRQLLVNVDATPVHGLRPSVQIDLPAQALVRGVLSPSGALLQVDGDSDVLVLSAPLIELHGSGDYTVLYRTPDPVAAQGGLLAWFVVLMMALVGTAGFSGYLVVRHLGARSRGRYVASGVYAALLISAAVTLSRVLFSGDLFIMVRTPLSAVATVQYVLLGVLTVMFGVLAATLGARQMRLMVKRLRIRARKAEALEEQQEQMETFTAAAAHDLRAPLRAISGHIALAQRALPERPERAVILMDRAVDGVRRMDELVTALLDHSQVTNADPEAIEFHTAEAAAQAITDLQPTIRARGADVAIEGDALIQGDPRLVRQAVQNLIQNAIKYSDDAPWVRVRIEQLDDSVNIRVVDRGRGIPRSEQGKVLEAFERASNGRDRDGTGLGLATVRKIMELHRGSVELQSEEGQGTTFTLWFPRDPIDEVLLPDGSPASELARV